MSLVFHHAPHSRSTAIHWLLEELGVDYTLETVDIRGDGGVPEAYRAIHPNKKVPAIVHDGVVVTERAAITAYLCDAFPAAGLAPALGDARRGPYLSWLAYVDGVFDPGLAMTLLGIQPPKMGVSFGVFAETLAHVERSVTDNDYVLGDTFSAADTQLACMLHWAIDRVRAVPETPALRAYLQRTTSRPAFQRAR